MPPVKRAPQPPPPNFLRLWILRRNLKLKDVAERLGVDPSTMTRWCNRESPIDQRLLPKLTKILDCSVEDLFSTNPSVDDLPRIIYLKLKKASHDIQEQVDKIVDVLLKAS